MGGRPTNGPAPTAWGERESLDGLLDRARDHARAYVTGLSERSVFPGPREVAALEQLGGPLPQHPTAPPEVLDHLHAIGSPATVAQTGGRYFGFVDGGAIPVGVAARWLADVWDQNTAHFVMSPVGCKLEEICERWVTELLGLPDGTAAGFVTGTTMANLSGLAAGRNELLRRKDYDVAARGLAGAPALRVVVGGDAHASVTKALALLGIGSEQLERVPADDQGRMRVDRLPELDESTLVVTQAGNVNSGAFDPIGEICDRAHARGGWVHVDGAFGLWAGASRALRPVYAGVERADSWSVDAHKTLNVPYDSGIALCRDREAFTSAFRASAAYFQWSADRDGMDYTPSMSKRARCVELWAVLKSLGRSGVEQLVDQLCARARLFADGLRGAGFRIHNDVVFNQVLAACDDDALTNATLARLQTSGDCWCGGSTWNGAAVIRVSVCSWATTVEDVQRSLAAFVTAREAARAAR